MGLDGWLVMLLVWVVLVAVAIWAITRLIPTHGPVERNGAANSTTMPDGPAGMTADPPAPSADILSAPWRKQS